MEVLSSSPNNSTLFIFKTLNFGRGDFDRFYIVTSHFKCYRMREIAFNIFGNPHTDNLLDDERHPVKIYDVYPMTEVGFDHMQVGNVHPKGFFRKGTADLMVDLIGYMGLL